MRRPHVLLQALLFCLVALAAPLSSAADVLVVMGQRGELQDQFLATFERELAHGGRHRITRLLQAAEAVPPPLDPPALVLCLGAEASRRAIDAGHRAVLAVLVSSRDAESLVGQPAGVRVTSIVLDQPAARSLRLIRALVPDARAVAVLLSPDATAQRAMLASAAAAEKLETNIAEISSEQLIVQPLERLLQESEALLALPDASIYNRNTVMSILLTSYRLRRPVIGFTPAYVRAGAVAAVHSDPTDVARQAAELLSTLSGAEDLKSQTLPPSYFRVSLNPRVARSLGLVTPGEAALEMILRAAEARR